MLNLTKGRLLAALCALTLAAQAAHAAESVVKINEIQANNATGIIEGSITDWVELINTSAAPVNISNFGLTDNDLDPTKWTFPPGTIIPANGLLVVAFDPDRAASIEAEAYLNTGYGLKTQGATLTLFAANFLTELDKVAFGNQVADYSIGRINGAWTFCTPTPNADNTAAALGSALSLKVNEWMANPAAGDDDWFEIYNPGTLPVALEGLFVTDTPTDPNTFFPIAPLNFVGTGQDAYIQFIADGNTDGGPEHVLFSLKAGGEALGIFDATGRKIDSVTFLAQSQGVSQGRLLDGSATIASFPGTASPAQPNYKAVANIVVNELLAHTDPPFEDAVEFYNTSNQDVNIGGWYLSNKAADLKKYRVPDNTTIAAKSYLVIYEKSFNNTNDPINNPAPFTFNSAHGDQVYLSEALNGNITGYRVSEVFEPSENEVSMGRVYTSVLGDYKFVQLEARTFGVDNPATVEQFRTGTGKTNSPPKIGPVAINEVHYNPLSLDGSDNREDEFIELYNFSSAPVPLYDTNNPANHWRLQNGVSFVFPGGRTIPANGYVLVISFDPAEDPIGVANFRARWRIPANVPIFGPFKGDLNNNGDSLELYKPDPPQLPPHPDAGFVPYIRVDKVNYLDNTPWPSTTDGTGFSLQRRNARAFGNEPLNWDGAKPTPGAANSPELSDTDGDGMTDTWEVANDFDINNPADATLDTDNDTMSNRDEFFAGTNPRSASSRLQITAVSPPRSEAEPLTITFNAVAGKAYTIQYKDGLDIFDDWEKLKDIFPEDFDRPVIVEDPVAILKVDRYYRVIIR
ncbi:MAG TPA: lamin tail domain-containing protein [Verrucomicrobiae bacterium]|nr:lamin tail domain-containing protein [Verrucomicrobiae bacterium]